MFLGGPPVASGGSPTGAVASFQIQADGALTPITLAALDFQLDTCWLENDGRYAYWANYTSGTISSFGIGAAATYGCSTVRPASPTSFRVALSQAKIARALRLSTSGSSINSYIMSCRDREVGAWKINEDGSLTKIDEYNDLPKTVDGDHAPFEFGPGGSPVGLAGY